MSINHYKIAGHIVAINDSDSQLKCWERMAPHYTPFATAIQPALLTVELKPIADATLSNDGWTAVFTENAKNEGEMDLHVYRRDDDWMFAISQPGHDALDGCLLTNGSFDHATLAVSEAGEDWHADSTLTAGMMLAFVLATACEGTLLAHAAAVLHEGRAVLMIGRSGTGKSTHARMWLNNIPETTLLNDDHPVLRPDENGTIIAYGSPWSGKTHCYRNMSAPLAAMVRIKQAPHNEIVRLAPVQAYASVSTSFSAMTWLRKLADAKHAAVERLVTNVPCYLLECLPNGDAARVCFNAVMPK